MRNHPACNVCGGRDGCLFRQNDDVESCGDVQDFAYEQDSSTDTEKKKVPNENPSDEQG